MSRYIFILCSLIFGTLPADAQLNYGNEIIQAQNQINPIFQGPYGAFVKTQLWMATHPTAAWMIVIFYGTALLASTTNILLSFREADRICWFLVVMMLPFFGILMFWLIGSNERLTESERDYIKRMGGK